MYIRNLPLLSEAITNLLLFVRDGVCDARVRSLYLYLFLSSLASLPIPGYHCCPFSRPSCAFTSSSRIYQKYLQISNHWPSENPFRCRPLADGNAPPMPLARMPTDARNLPCITLRKRPATRLNSPATRQETARERTKTRLKLPELAMARDWKLTNTAILALHLRQQLAKCSHAYTCPAPPPANNNSTRNASPLLPAAST